MGDRGGGHGFEEMKARTDALSFPIGSLFLVRIIHIQTESLPCTANKLEHMAVLLLFYLCKWIVVGACFLKSHAAFYGGP